MAAFEANVEFVAFFRMSIIETVNYEFFIY